VNVSTSWLLITVIMVGLFAPRIHGWLPGISALGAVLVALGYTLILAVSVLIHELGHAFTARTVGWTGSTIEITLWGGHTTFNEVDSTPGRSLVVSFAGPAANLILGGMAIAAVLTLDPAGVPRALLVMGAWGNLLLGVFNLLPGLPLDGGRLVEAIGWRVSGSRATGTIAAGWAGRIVALLGVAALVVSIVRDVNSPPFLELAIGIAVLLPLFTGAGSAIRYGRLRRRVEGLSLQALTSPLVILDPGSSVQDAEAAGVDRGTVVMVSMAAGSGPSLLRILPEAVAAVAPEDRRGTPATRAGVAADDAGRLTHDATGDAIVEAVISSVSGSALIVDDRGTPIGAIRRENLISALEGADQRNV
jgi:Zn-dependent protease